MIDYRPLQQPVAFRDRLREPWGWMMIVYAAAFIILAGLTLREYGQYGLRFELYFFLFGLLTVAAVLFFGLYNRTAQTIRLRHFADTNRLEYGNKVPYDQRDGMIFTTGHSQIFVDLLKSNRHDFAEIGNFQYVTGGGRSRQEHNNGFVRIMLDRRLPHMVLDAKANNFLGRISNLNVGFNKDQRLSLEGDFDKHFSLYAAPQYKTDALYIFTPDVMASMIDKAHTYDIEIIDNNLYLYANKHINLTDIKQMEEIFAIAEQLRRRVNKQARNYADERVGARELDVVDDTGARMNTGLSIRSIIILIIIGAMIIWNVVFRGILQY